MTESMWPNSMIILPFSFFSGYPQAQVIVSYTEKMATIQRWGCCMVFNQRHYFPTKRWLLVNICGVLLLVVVVVVPMAMEHYRQSVMENGKLKMYGPASLIQELTHQKWQTRLSYYKPLVSLPVLLAKLGYSLCSLTSKSLSTWTWPNLVVAYFQDPWAKRNFWLRLDLHRPSTKIKPSILLSLLKWLLRKIPRRAQTYILFPQQC